jgi:hypothetical protein
MTSPINTFILGHTLLTSPFAFLGATNLGLVSWKVLVH